MTDNQYRIFKVLFLVFLCYILYNWIQTERYYVVGNNYVFDKIEKKVFPINRIFEEKKIGW